MRFAKVFVNNFEGNAIALNKPLVHAIENNINLEFKCLTDVFDSENKNNVWNVSILTQSDVTPTQESFILTESEPLKMGALTICDVSHGYHFGGNNVGIIRDQIYKEFESQVPRFKDPKVIELVVVNLRSSHPIRTKYIRFTKAKRVLVPDIPGLVIDVISEKSMTIDHHKVQNLLTECVLRDQNSDITQDMMNKPQFGINEGSAGRIKTDNVEIFLRFANRVKPAKSSFRLNKTYFETTIFLLLCTFLVNAVFFTADVEKEQSPKEVLRHVATVQVQTQIQPAPAPQIPEPAKQVATKKMVTKQVSEPIKKPTQSGLASLSSMKAVKSLTSKKVINEKTLLKTDPSRETANNSSRSGQADTIALSNETQSAKLDQAIPLNDPNRSARSAAPILASTEKAQLSFQNVGKDGGYQRQMANSNNQLTVSGPLTPEKILKALQGTRRAIRVCYEKAQLLNLNVEGEMQYHWSINAKGKVSAIQLKSGSIQNQSFDSCVQQKIESTKFPKASSGQSTEVDYVFKLTKI